MIPALIVPVLNRPDLLNRMLASIDYPVGDLLVIDNGRCATERRYVPMAERVHYLPMPTNLGVPVSWNLGIKSLPHAHYWIVMNSDAWFPPGSLEALHAAARRDALVLSGAMPPWACYLLGDLIVERVGLFDEALTPAYFEDNDMERRIEHAGMDIVRTSVPIGHDNSSTIRSDERLNARNNETFTANAAYYGAKVAQGDYSEGRWSLTRRRTLSWD